MTTTIEDDGLRAIDTDEIAAVLFAQRQTPYVWADAIDAPAESDEGTLVSICRDDAAAVLAALRSSPAVDGVGVKLLNWVDEGDGLSRAKTSLGFSYFANHRTNMWLGLDDDWAVCEGSPTDAAQADYEARIRSALSPTSDRASVVEACAAAALGEPENALRAADPDHPESDYACGRVDAAMAVRAALSQRSS